MKPFRKKPTDLPENEPPIKDGATGATDEGPELLPDTESPSYPASKKKAMKKAAPPKPDSGKRRTHRNAKETDGNNTSTVGKMATKDGPELYPNSQALTGNRKMAAAVKPPAAHGRLDTSEKVHGHSGHGHSTKIGKQQATKDGPELYPDTHARSDGKLAAFSGNEKTFSVTEKGEKGVARYPISESHEDHDSKLPARKDVAGLSDTRGEGSPAATATNTTATNEDVTRNQSSAVPARPVRNRLQLTNSGIRPGAVAIRGVDATGTEDEEVDEDFDMEEATVEPPRPSIPEARAVSEEDDPGKKLIDSLVRAEPAVESDMDKEGGAMGWVKDHKLLTSIIVLVVVGGIVGGAVAATLSSDEPSSTPMPTASPTRMPTPAPTTTGFDLVSETLSEITPISTMTDPKTPQYAAVNWLLLDDGYNLDFDDAPKVLQRYALATIYFATNGNSSWTNQLQFLSDQDECMWNVQVDQDLYGVLSCNEQGLVDGLQLCKSISFADCCLLVMTFSFLSLTLLCCYFLSDSGKWASGNTPRRNRRPARPGSFLGWEQQLDRFSSHYYHQVDSS